MKKTKKNKIILGASIGLALVSVTTIGLSTWLVGLQQNSITLGDMTVSVDTVSDETEYLSVVVDGTESINIREAITAEATEGTLDGVTITGESGNVDLEVKLTDFDIVYSSDATLHSLSITPKLKKGQIVTSWPVVSMSNKTLTYPGVSLSQTDYFGRSGTSFTYIELEDPTSYSSEADLKNNNIFKESDTTYTGYKFYEKTEKNLNFKWGSLFDGDAPSVYYNEKLESVTDTGTKLQMLNQIKNELANMATAFEDQNIVIEVVLNVTPNI